MAPSPCPPPSLSLFSLVSATITPRIITPAALRPDEGIAKMNLPLTGLLGPPRQIMLVPGRPICVQLLDAFPEHACRFSSCASAHRMTPCGTDGDVAWPNSRVRRRPGLLRLKLERPTTDPRCHTVSLYQTGTRPGDDEYAHTLILTCLPSKHLRVRWAGNLPTLEPRGPRR